MTATIYRLDDPTQGGDPDWIRASDETFAVEFANPWHDEIGRFAPKGTGSKSDGLGYDPISELPPRKPGETPIPDGAVRLTHRTWTDNVESIMENGLENRDPGDGSGDVVWAAAGTGGDQRGYSDGKIGGPWQAESDVTFFEFWMMPDELGIGKGEDPAWLEERNAHVTMGAVPPDRFVGAYMPWHAAVWAFESRTAGTYDEVKSGRYDKIGEHSPNYGKAIEYIKREELATVAQFHLSGTGNDHNQQSHAGDGGGSVDGGGDEVVEEGAYRGDAAAETERVADAARRGVDPADFDGPVMHRGIAITVDDDLKRRLDTQMFSGAEPSEFNQQLHLGPEIVDQLLAFEGHQGIESLSGLGQSWTTREGVAESVSPGAGQNLVVKVTGRPRQSDILIQEVDTPDGRTDFVDADGNPVPPNKRGSMLGGEMEVRVDGRTPIDIIDVQVKQGSQWQSVWGDDGGHGAGAEELFRRYPSLREELAVSQFHVEPSTQFASVRGGDSVDVDVDLIELPADVHAAARQRIDSYLAKSPSAEFANPWHDERGRFAPKGTGRRSTGERTLHDAEAEILETQIAVSDVYSFGLTDDAGERYFVQVDGSPRTYIDDGTYIVDGYIENEMGDSVGEFQRWVIPSQGVVMNERFNIEPEFQNKGIGTAFLDLSEEALLNEFGIDKAEITAVDVGKYAWAARGYQLAPGTAPAERTRSQWTDGANKVIQSGTLTASETREAQAVLDHWRRDPSDIYGADLLAVNNGAFRDVFLDGDNWSGVKEITPPFEEQIAASGAQFANPWHDELGRFAPKGAGRKSTGVTDLFAGGVPDEVVVAVDATVDAIDWTQLFDLYNSDNKKSRSYQSGVEEVVAALDAHTDVAADMVDSAAEALVARAATSRLQDDAIRSTAARYGITAEEVETSMVSATTKLLADAPVAVRVGQESLERILASGRFKTQFETDRSSGTYNRDARAAAEMQQMGYDPNTPPEERPVYGYFDTPSPNIGLGRGGVWHGLNMYGQIEMHLTPEAKARSTVTFGDSLGEVTVPSDWRDPSIYSVAYPKVSGNSFFDIDRPESNGNVPYIEAQIHGGVDLSDIARVKLPPRPGLGYLTDQLDAAGIPWETKDEVVFTITDAVTASAGPGPVIYVGDGDAVIHDAGVDEAGRPLGQVERDGHLHDPHLIAGIIAHGGDEWADATMVASGAEFANPWHDEIGRFAPKGTGSKASDGPVIEDDVEAYAGLHRPNDNGPRAFDLWESEGTDGLDVYENPHFYTGYSGVELQETMAQLEAVRGDPKALLWVYRAAPRGADINDGDWVTLSPTYAQNHIDSGNAGPDGVIVAEEAEAREVRWAMDDMMEWGYFPELKYDHFPEMTADGVRFAAAGIYGAWHRRRRFTARSRTIAFANPWHDERGRFAPKGTGSKSGPSLDEVADEGVVEGVTQDEVVAGLELWDGDAEYEMNDGARLYQAPDGRYVTLDPDDNGVWVNAYDEFSEVAWDLDLGDLADQARESWLDDAVRTIGFHGTTAENAAAIRDSGLGTRNLTRGINNRWVGNSVFTTSDPELARQYGDVVVQVDIPRAVEDGVIDRYALDREPGYHEAEARSRVALSFDEQMFDPWSEFVGTGEDPTTIIIGTDVPSDYLTFLDEFGEQMTARKRAEFANPWHDERGRFAPKGTGSRSSGRSSTMVGRAPEGYQVGLFGNAERDVQVVDSEHADLKKRVDRLADGVIEELDDYAGFVSRYPHPTDGRLSAELKASLEEMPPEIIEGIDSIIETTRAAYRVNEPIQGEAAEALRAEAEALKQAVADATSTTFTESFQVPDSPPTKWTRDGVWDPYEYQPGDPLRVVSESGQVEINIGSVVGTSMETRVARKTMRLLSDDKIQTIMDGAQRAIDANPVLADVPISIEFDHSGQDRLGVFGEPGTTLGYVSAPRYGNDPSWRTVNLHPGYMTDDRDVGQNRFRMGSQPFSEGLRWTVMHELGHTAAFERSRLDGDPFDTWASEAVRVINNGNTALMSGYGKTSTLEAHAEAFAEWSNTAGTTNNPVVQWYANRFGWRAPTSASIEELTAKKTAFAMTGFDAPFSDDEPLTRVVSIDDIDGTIDTTDGPLYPPLDEALVASAATVDEFANRYLDDLTAAMSRSLSTVQDQVIERLRSSATELVTEPETMVAAPGSQPFDLGSFNLMDAADWADAFQVEAADLIGDVVVDAGTGVPLRAGLNVADDVITDLINRHVERLTNLGTQVRGSVASTLEAAVRDRMPLDDVVELMQERGPIGEANARAIARTELTAAQNGGMFAGWRRDDVPFKQWVSLHDDRVRDPHLEADGQIVPVEQEFEVGGYPAMYPGDPRLPVGLRINCRCYMERVGQDGQAVPGNLADATKKELYSLAQELNIRGRSRMNKDELFQSIDRWRNGFGEQALESLTRPQLIARAKTAGIAGRWRMRKPELMVRLRQRAQGRTRAQWLIDAGHAPPSVQRLARNQLEIDVAEALRQSRRGQFASAPSALDTDVLRQAVFGRYQIDDTGWVPCVGCGARLHWSDRTIHEQMTLMQIDSALPWDARTTIPVCRADAAALATADLPALVASAAEVPYCVNGCGNPAVDSVELSNGIDALVCTDCASTEFANPWHDEIGRFAPKGTGRKSPGTAGMLEAEFTPNNDGPLEYPAENRREMLLTYGTMAVANTMSEEERAAVEDLVSDLTLADEDKIGRIASGTADSIKEFIDRDVMRHGEKIGTKRMPREKVPLGLAEQISAAKFATRHAENGKEILDSLRPDIDAFVDGNMSADDLSARITEATGIDQTTAIVRQFASSWNWNSVGIPGYAMQAAAERMRGLDDAGNALRSGSGHSNYKASIAEQMASATDAIASGVYYTTQDALRRIAPNADGFDMYRGLRWVDSADYAIGDVVQPYPLSSWTSNESYASVFTGGDRSGPVIRTSIPREDIWSLSSATGFGDYDREIIAFGEWNLIDSVRPGYEIPEWTGETA